MPKHNILLVDDSQNVLNALLRLFRSDGYGLHTAQSAQDALKVIAENEIDLIISDEGMPGLQGTELLRLIKERFPTVIRFMLTGVDDIRVAQRAINSGEIARFFTKPWNDSELTLAVREALERRGLEQENSRLRQTIQAQDEMLSRLEKEHPGISSIRYADDGAIVIDPSDE